MDYKMFKQKNYWFYYFNLPIIILFISTFFCFIFATFYDETIANFFAHFYFFINIRYCLKLYDILGGALITISVPIAIAIILESFLLSHKKKLSWFFKNNWITWCIYIIFIIIFCYFNITSIFGAKTIDKGYGPGIDVHFVLTWQPVVIIKTLVFIIVLITDITFFILLKFKFIKNNEFIAQKYWLDSIKIISILLLYIIIWLMKKSFGRPFYFTIHFKENNIDQMLKEIGGLPNTNLLNGFNNFYYGINGDIVYHPWYFPNNFSQNFTWKYLWKWSPFISEYMRGNNDGWNNGAFPSGHIVASYSFLAILFYFIGKNRKVNFWKIIIICFLGLFLLSMNFNLIAAQTHWLTDTCFSMMCSTLFLWLSSYFINKKI